MRPNGNGTVCGPVVVGTAVVAGVVGATVVDAPIGVGGEVLVVAGATIVVDVGTSVTVGGTATAACSNWSSSSFCACAV